MRIVALTLLAAPALLGAQAQTPQPGPEVKQLQVFAGRWTSTGEMKPGPMGPGGPVTGSSTCEWFSGGFWLVCRSEGRGPTGMMHSMAILGYNPEIKRYTYYGIDNSGMPGGISYTNGPVGDSWAWEGESMMGGQTIKGRYTTKRVSADEYTWTYEAQMGTGPWMTMGTGTEKRAK